MHFNESRAIGLTNDAKFTTIRRSPSYRFLVSLVRDILSQKHTPDVIALTGLAAHSLMTEEAKKVDILTRILSCFPIDALLTSQIRILVGIEKTFSPESLSLLDLDRHEAVHGRFPFSGGHSSTCQGQQ